jgi:subtilase family serine protease
MPLRKLWVSICLANGAGIFSQLVLAQGPFPLVPSADSGFYRPFVWMSAAPDTQHGPGSTTCSSSNPCYYFPFDVTRAYATAFISNGNGGAGRTIAIVDAFHYPSVDADLHSFSAAFVLPDCTVANGCFTVVDQTGGPPGAGFNAGWALETNLDVQWAHAIAPNAKILLVEGDTNSITDLGAAVLYARGHGDVVSNSYGANEFAGESGFDGFYSGSNVPILFSSGDTGGVGQYPCASIYVVCVGGTSLFETSTSFRAFEGGWSGSGGGCSTQISQPSWQGGVTPCSTTRAMPDVAAIADPDTGVLVYISDSRIVGTPGFYIVGGTSAASPLTAGVVALIQNARLAIGKSEFTGANFGPALYTVAAGAFYHYRYYDVTSGNNGFAAGPGFDLVTGFGVALGPSVTFGLVGLP